MIYSMGQWYRYDTTLEHIALKTNIWSDLLPPYMQKNWNHSTIPANFIKQKRDWPAPQIDAVRHQFIPLRKMSTEPLIHCVTYAIIQSNEINEFNILQYITYISFKSHCHFWFSAMFYYKRASDFSKLAIFLHIMEVNFYNFLAYGVGVA